MVRFAPLVGAAILFSGFAAARPTNSNSNSYGGDNSNYGSSSDNSNYGSSSDNSNYGGDSGSNYGGNSGSSYGGNSGSNYGGNSGSNYGGSDSSSSYTTTAESSSVTDYTSSYDSTSTYGMTDVQETSTTTSYNSYQTPSYGSGSNYWGGSGYEDCVNQCMAQYGSGMGGSYQATATSGSYGNSGSGATHTIIVGPEEGSYRFMPFAVNASVGDTLEFHWGSDKHTVTKSSELLPCNKSSEDPVFASGEQNKDFVFREIVNNTDPIYYYCGTPNHCQKGMFGMINPPQALPGAPSSAGGMMSSMMSSDPNLSAYAAYANNKTSGNDAAYTWGTNIDMGSMPDWAQSAALQNIYYTRLTMAMNSEIIKGDGSIDLSSATTTPIQWPVDPSAINNAAAAPSAASSDAATPAAAAATSDTSSASSAASPSPSTNGASSVASPRFLVAAVVVLATIFAL